MMGEFKSFLLRGNVVDLAVGVIIGSAFGKIVSSLVEDVLMPPLALLIGKVDFSGYFIPLSLTDRHFGTLAEAKAAGVTTLNIGLFANALFQFLLVACAIFFFVVKPLGRLKKSEGPAPKPAQEALLEEIRDLLKQKNLKG